MRIAFITISLLLLWVFQACSKPESAPAIKAKLPDPIVRILLSAGLQGSLEPCGCGGFQKGGLRARVDMVDSYGDQEQPWVVDGGALLTDGPFDGLLLPVMEKGLQLARTRVMALGPAELKHLPAILKMNHQVACANLVGAEGVEAEVTISHGRVGITSVIDNRLSTKGLKLSSARKALQRVASKALSEGRPTVVFLHAKGPLRISLLDTARRSGAPLMVVDMGWSGDSLAGVTKLGAGRVYRFRLDGMDLVELKLDFSPGGFGAALHDLSWGAAKPGQVVHSAQVVPARQSGDGSRAVGIAEEYAELLSRQIDPTGAGYKHYVGATKCGECHPAELARWEKTPHAHSMNTLQRIGKADRPDCYSCHVTGNAAAAGIDSVLRPAPKLLQAVGCETCHGAGHEHSFSGGKVSMGPSQVNCSDCHRSKFSPGFSKEHALPYASCQSPLDAPVSSKRFSLPR